MLIQVRLFAALAENVGTWSFALELPAGSSADAVRAAVLLRYPQVKGLCGRSVLAVNAEYTEPDRLLEDGDEVALIPPVSGG